MEKNNIVRIIGTYLSGRFSPETEEKVQKWIIKDKDTEEKEKASLEENSAPTFLSKTNEHRGSPDSATDYCRKLSVLYFHEG